MYMDSTKGRFKVDRDGKCLIFTNNLYIKKGHSVLIFIFNCKWHVSMCTNKKLRKVSKCSGEMNKTKISSTYRQIHFLATNIPLEEETIDICTNRLFANTERVECNENTI